MQYFKQLRFFLTLASLLLVVLFSSCNVRKTLQAQLEIPVTKSLNAAKATLNNNSICKGVTEVTGRITHREACHDVVGLLLYSFTYQSAQVVCAENLAWCSSQAKNTDQIPLYILYQNRKIIA